MSILEALILGLIQGATEFLPVSSSGHLILACKILGMYQISIGFELVCHLGTLLAVVIAMRQDIFAVIKKPLSRQSRLILVATIPTVIIVAVFQGFFRKTFGGEYLVYGFLITAILLLISGFAPARAPLNHKMRYIDAIIIGTAQGIAALPGISRSGATMTAGTLMGLGREESAKFSFLISIPIILGSSLLELITQGVGQGVTFLPLITGFAAAFFSGLIAVKFLLKILKKFNFDAFAIYLFMLATFLLLNDFVFHIF